MIPYLEWTSINIGPVGIHVWGLFAAVGFIFGAAMASWQAQRRGLDSKIIFDILPWLILGGLVGGRLGHVLFYALPYYLEHPLEIFAVWEGGLSLFGGFIACLLIGIWYLRRRQVNFMAYADTLVFGLPFGLIFGRIGCFLIHDHPGTATHFFLGVKYPDGVVRHDHGLYEALLAVIMSAVFLYVARRPQSTGTYMAIFCIWYGLARFGLDFYRVADVRYAGLTPAQYLCLVLVATGVGIIVWIRAKRKQT